MRVVRSKRYRWRGAKETSFYTFTGHEERDDPASDHGTSRKVDHLCPPPSFFCRVHNNGSGLSVHEHDRNQCTKTVMTKCAGVKKCEEMMGGTNQV